MSVFLYIIGLVAPIVLVTQHPESAKLKPWSQFGIVVLWPIAFLVVAIILVFYLYREMTDG